jgi:hypothetical protein
MTPVEEWASLKPATRTLENEDTFSGTVTLTASEPGEREAADPQREGAGRTEQA